MTSFHILCVAAVPLSKNGEKSKYVELLLVRLPCFDLYIFR